MKLFQTICRRTFLFPLVCVACAISFPLVFMVGPLGEIKDFYKELLIDFLWNGKVN